MIEIQGIPYKIIKHTSVEEISDLYHEVGEETGIEPEDMEKFVDGFVDYNRKEIHMLYIKGFKNYQMVLRHEIIHAFLYEIGNVNHGNEEFVDKLSKWIPQIERLRKEAERY